MTPARTLANFLIFCWVRRIGRPSDKRAHPHSLPPRPSRAERQRRRMSDPETISWRDALTRLIETGHAENTAATTLVEAVLSNAVGYYPRRALDLGSAFRAGRFDPQTGAWRMHSLEDNPFSVRLIRSEFERWLSKLPQPSKAGSEPLSAKQERERRGPEPTKSKIVDAAKRLIARDRTPTTCGSWENFRRELCAELGVDKDSRGYQLDTVQNAVRPLLRSSTADTEQTESTES
jgi:hypothetical protein